ncbi:MAG: hypothetical protein ACM359_10675 [Bacillota bacterium]
MFNTIIDGRLIAAGRQITCRRRPMVATDAGLDFVCESLFMSHVPNQPAIKLTPAWLINNQWIEWNSMVVRNVHTEDLTRNVAAHTDHLFIDGWQKNPGDLLVENLYCEGGWDQGIMSLFITNGSFRHIILRNIVTVAAKTPMIDMRCGTVGSVLIENCPNLKLIVQGNANSIGPIAIRNSPGCWIANAAIDGISPNPQVIFEKPAYCPTCKSVVG